MLLIKDIVRRPVIDAQHANGRPLEHDGHVEQCINQILGFDLQRPLLADQNRLAFTEYVACQRVFCLDTEVLRYFDIYANSGAQIQLAGVVVRQQDHAFFRIGETTSSLNNAVEYFAEIKHFRQRFAQGKHCLKLFVQLRRDGGLVRRFLLGQVVRSGSGDAQRGGNPAGNGLTFERSQGDIGRQKGFF